MQATPKRAHAGPILALIRQHPGISRAEIARTLRLTRSSVSDAVGSLIHIGLVRDRGRSANKTAGRRPRELWFAGDYGQIIAVDLGGTTLRAAVVDLEGTILARTQRPVTTARLEDQLRRIIRMMLADDAVKHPLAIGIGVAGTVDRSRGIVLDAPALERSHWDIIAGLRGVSSLPVVLDNDVNLAALGEQWRGAAKGRANVVCLSVGTGIGAGVIVDGHLYRGARGLAGEAGHLYQRSEAPAQQYDTFGDLELQAAGFGIAQRAQEMFAATVPASRSTTPLSKDGPPDAHAVFQAAGTGDAISREIIAHAATQIGVAIGNMISLLDPEIVVLLGGIGLGQVSRLLPSIREVVQRITPPGSRGHVAIVGGELGDDAVLIGAACAGQEALGLR